MLDIGESDVDDGMIVAAVVMSALFWTVMGCRQFAPFKKRHHSPQFFRSTGRFGGVNTSEPAKSMCGNAPG